MNIRAASGLRRYTQGAASVELLIVLLLVGVLGSAGFVSLGVDLRQGIAGPASRDRFSLSAQAGTSATRDQETCESLLSLCTLHHAVNKVTVSGPWKFVTGIAERASRGLYWRTRQNASGGLATSWGLFEVVRDALVDTFTVPLQVAGNQMSVAQWLTARSVKLAAAVYNGTFRGYGPPPIVHEERKVPTLWGTSPTLYRSARDPSDDLSILPEDVQQGGLGDCVALAAFAAIAQQNGGLIRNAIHDNGDGTYTVSFWKQRPPGFVWEQEWTKQRVTVTAEVPVDGYGMPKYAGSPDGKLWVSILEKAWAEVNGGYDAINGDASFGPLEALTGRSSTTNVPLPGLRRMPGASDLKRMLEHGYAIVADSGFAPDDPIAAFHQYYIVGVYPGGTVSLGEPGGSDPLEISYAEFAKNFTINYAPTR